MKNQSLFGKINQLYRQGNSKIKFKLHDEQFGDEYHSEESVIYKFKIGDNFYEVGYCKVVEDDDDWAQAESYNYDIFRKNDQHVHESEILSDVDNYLQIQRDSQLNKILND